MVAKIFICMLVASLLYAYTNHNREFRATASAIRQIWSGTCRLSCRQSEYSRFSGLSGLDQLQNRVQVSSLSDKTKQGQISINHQAGPSSVCVCETCPCALVESIFRTCSPVTNLYSQIIETTSNLFDDLVRSMTDLYVYIERVASCGVSCQRTAQLTSPKVNSLDKINFGDASSSVKDGQAKKLGKQILNRKPSTTSFRRQSDDELAKAVLNTSGHNLAVKLRRDSLTSKSESKESYKGSKSCSKCIEKGKVCMNNCPRSKDKNK